MFKPYLKSLLILHYSGNPHRLLFPTLLFTRFGGFCRNLFRRFATGKNLQQISDLFPVCFAGNRTVYFFSRLGIKTGLKFNFFSHSPPNAGFQPHTFLR